MKHDANRRNQICRRKDRDLTEFDENVLRSISGVDVPGMVWGAAMTVAVEWLHNQGYVRRVPHGRHGDIAYVCTDKGRDYLQKFNQT